MPSKLFRSIHDAAGHTFVEYAMVIGIVALGALTLGNAAGYSIVGSHASVSRTHGDQSSAIRQPTADADSQMYRRLSPSSVAVVAVLVTMLVTAILVMRN